MKTPIRLRWNLSRRRARGLAAAFCLCLGLWAALAFSPLPESVQAQDWSSALLSSQGRLLHLTLNQAGRYRIRLGLAEISPAVVQGFLAYEDKWFYWHPGVNPVAVLKAAFLNLRHGRVLSGASTITMQLARMAERRPRSFRAKLWEALRALQLEARFSKREILERYLNSVPMGGNIEGVGAASLLYFGKLPGELSQSEAALLVSLPRSPSTRRPDRSGPAARAGRDQVLQRLGAPAAPDSPPPSRRLPNPQLAQHWVQHLAPDLAREPGLRTSTLDDSLQALAEDCLRAAGPQMRRIGVHNGALVIVENRSAKIRAYVGSPDFLDRHDGQVNGADIPRSPGSALKPFLYARALESGLISPHSTLYDIPRDYGGYRPVNFSGSYTGPVSAEDALIHSLNTPAVWLEAQMLDQPGGDLEALLKRAGLDSRGRDRLDPGLSVALGAHPVTVEEMASLYLALAHGGLWQPLNSFEDRPPARARVRLVGEGAAFLVTDMLSKVRRPDLPSSWEYSPSRGRVAFKTGTSFGFRDAWCAAYNPDYTVVVWLGNASGVGAAGLKAAEWAAPVAIAVFNRLTRNQDRWFSPPAGVARREVCADSGAPPNAFCPAKEEEWYLPGVSPYEPCQVHRAVWVRRKDGRRVSADCMPGDPKQYQRKVLALWPPDVTRYLRGYKAKFQALPPAAPDCADLAALQPPRIISPDADGHFELGDLMRRSTQKLALSAEASADVDRLYWYVDDFLVGDSKPDQILFWEPTAGPHKVEVLDSRGRTDSVRLVVTEPRPANAAAMDAAGPAK